jgi:hypothetical protein
VAVWGYHNDADYKLRIPISNVSNWMKTLSADGSAYTLDQHQPIEFLPGRHVAVFETEFDASESQRWLVVAPNGFRTELVASKHSRGCAGA